MEIWKDIKKYEGLYQCSNLGRVRSLDRWENGGYGTTRLRKGKILKPLKSTNGYLRVCFLKDSKGQYYLIHRIVAETFIPNLDNLPCVNHKDEDKTNNCVDNLEWCSYQYNNNYGTRNQQVSDKLTNGKRSKAVYQYTLDGEFIREWQSMNEVQRQLGYDNSHIGKCCLGKQKQSYGYKWRYK